MEHVEVRPAPAPPRSGSALRQGERIAARRTPRVVPWMAGALIAAALIAVALWRMRAPAGVSPTAVTRRDVERVLVLTGRVRPPARPRIGSSLAGTVREVYVRDGDHITRGQLLVRLDDAQPAAALAQARAALAAAEVRTQSTRSQAQITVDQTSRDLGRARALYAQGAINARDLEVADRAAAAARLELDVARARVATATDGPLAEVARARAAVSAAEAVVALTRITAPANGVVLARDVEPGSVVVPGQALLDVSLAGPVELVVYSREENLAELRVGAAAVASADAFPRDTFSARIAWVSDRVDPAQGTVEARLSVPAPPSYLRADMTVSINVMVARHAGALVVPLDAVHDAAAAPWVTVAVNGRAERRPVQLGVRGAADVEVLSGLREGDRVLPAGVAPGVRVRER